MLSHMHTSRKEASIASMIVFPLGDRRYEERFPLSLRLLVNGRFARSSAVAARGWPGNTVPPVSARFHQSNHRLHRGNSRRNTDMADWNESAVAAMSPSTRSQNSALLSFGTRRDIFTSRAHCLK